MSTTPGTINKSFVSTLQLPSVSGGSVDLREIFDKVLDVARDEEYLMDILELSGNVVPSASPYYSHAVNTDLFKVEEVSAVATVTATAPAVLDITLVSAPGTETVLEGDLLMLKNEKQVYVRTKTIGANVVIRVQAVDATANATALGVTVGDKFTCFSDVSAEGSNSPDGLRNKPTFRFNQVTKMKKTFKLTDVELANATEIKGADGRTYFYPTADYENYLRFRAGIAGALMFSELSNPSWQQASPAQVDKQGLPWQTTRGLHHSIKELGLLQPGATVNLAYYKTLSNTLRARRMPSRYTVYTGQEGMNQHHDFAGLIAPNSWNANARIITNGKEIETGCDKLNIYGFEYQIVQLKALNHTEQYATGANGPNFSRNMYYVPDGMIKCYASGEMVPRIRARTFGEGANAMTNGITETMHGRLAPTVNSEEDTLKVVRSASIGLEVFGPEDFILTTLA